MRKNNQTTIVKPHESITINESELEENKDKIIDTLKNYQIGIADIKATIGPG